MKFFLAIVSVCFVAIQATKYELDEEYKKELTAIKKTCLDQHPNLELTHFEKLHTENIFVEDEELKQVVLCFQTKGKIYNDDGSFNVKKIKDDLFKAFKTHDFDKFVDECTKDDQHDAAKNSWPFLKCLHPKLPQLDYYY